MPKHYLNPIQMIFTIAALSLAALPSAYAQQEYQTDVQTDQTTPLNDSYGTGPVEPEPNNQFNHSDRLESTTNVGEEELATSIEESVSDSAMSVSPLSSDDSITVYLDASWGYRTTRAAENLTQSHSEYAKQGYKLQDVDLYTEDGDLKGFFITYTRVK